MLTLKQGLKLSAIVDKLGLKMPDAKSGQEQVGAELMMQVISRAHKAEGEIYEFVADMKKIKLEEAQDVDLMTFIKEVMANAGVRDFLSSAVTSQEQE